MEIPSSLVDRLLDTWPVARLATSGTRGYPGALPIVFALVRGYLWTPVDGKPKRAGELARVRRVSENPHVELLLDEYHDDWSDLWWLRIEGEARVVEPPQPERDPDVAPVLAALRKKYPQYATVPVLRDPPTLLAIRPTRIRSWAASETALAALESRSR
ncbi:MAG TPA: pyridoxamine 5'-phosphate oxidase family protein [Myxococcota bacterium]|nr:pyridoxamine 5'-phosphate oxidase family protein [Myxococcota bacterium]